MAISDKLTKLNDDLLAAYDAIESKGGTIPTEKNSENLAEAIMSIEKPIEYEGLKLTAQEDNSSVSYKISGSLPDIQIQYSYSGTGWHDWNANETISLMSGESIYVRNTKDTLSNLPPLGTANYFQFVMTGKISASGNVNSMINFAELSKYCYYSMFYGCSSLTTAPELPATTLVNSCYYNMFLDCTSLTTAPELPATTLAHYCYYSMFYGCSSLKVNENGTEGTKIFTCPDTSGSNEPTINMFSYTGGTFKKSPTTGNTYNWYK